MGNFLSPFRAFFRKRSPAVTCEALTPAGNPLPPTIHQVISQKSLKPGRLILIGDIHGCHDEFMQLLDKVQFNKELDNLVLVGDLVNKGPFSDRVVASAHELGALSVRGNHDDAALAAYQEFSRGQPSPKAQAKYGYLQGYAPGFAEYLTNMPFSLHIPCYGVLVVHAGVIPGIPVEEQSLADLYKMRDLRMNPKTGRWEALEKPAEDSKPWASQWKGEPHIFFGHDAKRRLQDYSFATGLDSGCVYGGELTACVLPPLDILSAEDMFTTRRQGRQPLKLGHLQGALMSVRAERAYVEPKGTQSD